MKIDKNLISQWATLCEDGWQNATRTEETVAEDPEQDTHREDLLCEMANKYQEETSLPMNIWIDDSQSYLHVGHYKRIKFQLDRGKGNPHNCGVMDLDGNIIQPTSPIRRLRKSDLEQLRNFVINNKYALEHIADVDIYTGQIWPYIITGGEPASNEEIAALNRKVDEFISNNKAKSSRKKTRKG